MSLSWSESRNSGTRPWFGGLAWIEGDELSSVVVRKGPREMSMITLRACGARCG